VPDVGDCAAQPPQRRSCDLLFGVGMSLRNSARMKTPTAERRSPTSSAPAPPLNPQHTSPALLDGSARNKVSTPLSMVGTLQWVYLTAIFCASEECRNCRVMRSCDASLFLCASCVRILPGFAAIYRAILLIFFVISGLRRTHNPLVGGSNPSGPTIKSIT